MSEEKLLSGQRYFISRVLEYFDFRYHQSPIFYRVLQDKRYDSILLMFHEYLEIERDIRKGTSDKTKLKHSMKSSLKNILFHCQQNPWALKGSSSRDISYLVKIIAQYLKEEEKDKENTIIQLSISGLIKRYNAEDLINEYIDMIMNVPLSYKEIDLLVQYFVSEIIGLGYSLKYLGEWKQENYLSASTKNLNKENLENRLLLFRELIKNPIEYSIILNIWLPDELKDELNQNEHIKINYEYCKLNTEEEAVVLEKAGKLNYPKAEQYQNVKVEVVAYDKYKAIEKVVKNLESYLEVYKHYLNIEKVAINVHCLLKDSGGNWGQMRTDSTDTHIFHRGMSEREKEDMKDFISLRDKIRLSEGSISTSINQLNNSLETLRKSIDDTQENRLLNNWSSLEYILNSYEGKSIIGKVIDIVPKVICLYHVKEQLNILWESIIRLTNSKDYEQLGNNREFNLAMLQRRKKI